MIVKVMNKGKAREEHQKFYHWQHWRNLWIFQHQSIQTWSAAL